MYAVIETGGKQFRVQQGDVIDVERLPLSGKKTKKVRFDRVLLLADEETIEVGTPVVKGAEVTAVLVAEVRGPKIEVFKMKRRKGYRRHTGHRQDLLRVRIDGIKPQASGTGRMKAERT